MEEEEGVQPELDDDGNVIHRCIYLMLCNIVNTCMQVPCL